ncbi:MAG: lysophospholipid acyltransferase family protein [Sphingomonadaceae bacterium]
MATSPDQTISLFGWLRLVLRLIALAMLLLASIPVHFIWRILAYGSPIPMIFLRSAGWIMGARVTIAGKPLRRNVFFISNHVSWLDIVVLAGATGTSFIAKAELEHTPLVGWMATLNRTVYVERSERGKISEQIDALKEALNDTWSVTIFPEGTTSSNDTLLPFKSALLKVLDPPPEDVRVQPVFLDYKDAASQIAWIGEESGLDNIRKILSRKGHFPVILHYLEPFSPVEVTGRKAIAAHARTEIETALRIQRGA